MKQWKSYFHSFFRTHQLVRAKEKVNVDSPRKKAKNPTPCGSNNNNKILCLSNYCLTSLAVKYKLSPYSAPLSSPSKKNDKAPPENILGQTSGLNTPRHSKKNNKASQENISFQISPLNTHISGKYFGTNPWSNTPHLQKKNDKSSLVLRNDLKPYTPSTIVQLHKHPYGLHWIMLLEWEEYEDYDFLRTKVSHRVEDLKSGQIGKIGHSAH